MFKSLFSILFLFSLTTLADGIKVLPQSADTGWRKIVCETGKTTDAGLSDKSQAARAELGELEKQKESNAGKLSAVYEMMLGTPGYGDYKVDLLKKMMVYAGLAKNQIGVADISKELMDHCKTLKNDVNAEDCKEAARVHGNVGSFVLTVNDQKKWMASQPKLSDEIVSAQGKIDKKREELQETLRQLKVAKGDKADNLKADAKETKIEMREAYKDLRELLKDCATQRGDKVVPQDKVPAPASAPEAHGVGRGS